MLILQYQFRFYWIYIQITNRPSKIIAKRRMFFNIFFFKDEIKKYSNRTIRRQLLEQFKFFSLLHDFEKNSLNLIQSRANFLLNFRNKTIRLSSFFFRNK